MFMVCENSVAKSKEAWQKGRHIQQCVSATAAKNEHEVL